MIPALQHIGFIGRLTFLEAVRQRFFNFLVLLALALIGCAGFFRQFDFGPQELAFTANFGLGSMVFFGSILAVVVTAQLFFSELDNRTALTLLAKPVQRWAFIAGKLLGVAMLMLVFVVLLTTLLGAYLWWRQGQFIALWHLAHLAGSVDTELPESMRVHFDGLAINALLQWLKFVVLGSITMVVASFANTNMYTVAVSFFIYLICQLQYIALEAYQTVDSAVVGSLVWVLSFIFPNFQLYSVGEMLVFTSKNPVPPGAVWAAIGYSVVYIAVFYGLAVFSFLSREI